MFALLFRSVPLKRGKSKLARLQCESVNPAVISNKKFSGRNVDVHRAASVLQSSLESIKMF